MCTDAVDEQGLQKEKEMVESRVNESRGKRLQDYVDVLPEMPPTPNKPDATSDVAAGIGEGDSSEGVVADPTTATESAVSPDSTSSSLDPNNSTINSAASSDEASGSTANRRASRRLVKTLSQKFDPAAMMSAATASNSGVSK